MFDKQFIINDLFSEKYLIICNFSSKINQSY